MILFTYICNLNMEIQNLLNNLNNIKKSNLFIITTNQKNFRLIFKINSLYL